MKKIIALLTCALLSGCSAYLYLIGFEKQNVITGQIINIKKFNMSAPEIEFLSSLNNEKSYNLILPFPNTYPSANRVIISKDKNEDLFISHPVELYEYYYISTSGLTKKTDVMELSKETSEDCLSNMPNCISRTYQNELTPIKNIITAFSTPFSYGQKFQFEKYMFDDKNVTIILAREMNKNDPEEEKLVPSIKGMLDSEKLLHIAIIKSPKSSFADLLKKKYEGYLRVGFFTGDKENHYAYKDFIEDNSEDICKTLSSCMFNVYLNSTISPKFKKDVVDSLYEVKVVHAGKQGGDDTADISLDGLAGFISSGAAQKKDSFDIKIKLLPKYKSLTTESETTIKTNLGLCIKYDIRQILFTDHETNCVYENITAKIPKNASSSEPVNVRFHNVVTNFGLNVGGLDAMNVSISDMKLVSEPIFISGGPGFSFSPDVRTISEGFGK